MTTTHKSVKYKGNCLMFGKESQIEIRPSENNTGITFINEQTGEKVVASVDNIIDTTHMIVLGTPSFNIRLAEHLMAALALNFTSGVEISITGNEVPAGDGSAKEFYKLINPIFYRFNYNDQRFNLPEPLYYTHKHTSISALPSDNFRISYCVNYPESPFEQKWYKWQADQNCIEDIISARTFGYVKELPLYQSQGYALGVTRENTIGINDDGTLTNSLRYPDEPVRHKVLDLIGDLYLAGINPLQLNAHIIAIECGHYQHVELARRIKNTLIV